ncbi:hypothetical protein TNIN_114731 [Trichonephila inaurata madagascariensis]|uniref:Uncharacterized protein n=1 Tax=Trichonephila inaurata madagascariensis TaxID=2747483 RepID=A0A8X6XFR0_9ARAC|nr:hypothetical protein TNIN_114731 [Trichonephila inaurata madagascariensis]
MVKPLMYILSFCRKIEPSIGRGNQNQIDNNPQGGMRGCLNSCLGAMGAIMCCRMMDDCFAPMGGFDEFVNPTSMEETDFGQDALDIDFN